MGSNRHQKTIFKLGAMGISVHTHIIICCFSKHFYCISKTGTNHVTQDNAQTLLHRNITPFGTQLLNTTASKKIAALLASTCPWLPTLACCQALAGGMQREVKHVRHPSLCIPSDITFLGEVLEDGDRCSLSKQPSPC